MDDLTTDAMFERLRRHAAAEDAAVTIHTNPDVSNGVPRPPEWGRVCVHPLSDPSVEYGGDTLTEALQRAYLAEVAGGPFDTA